MANYLKDLVNKAKRIKSEEEVVKPKEKKIKIDEEEVRKKLVLDKRKKEKLRKKALEEELMKKVPPKGKVKEAEEEEQEEKKGISSVDLELESMDKKEIDSYGEVKVFEVPGKILPYYVIPVTKPTLGERTIINTIKEAATRLISIAPYRIRDPEQRRTVYKQKIIEILQASNELNIPERRYNFYAESVVREMVGYGLIDSLIRDDRLEEIMVIGPKKPVYVFHREHEMMVTNIEFFADNEIEDLINRIGREVGRRVDISAPLLDARLADGSRVNATISPASISGASLTIRKFREDPYSIIDLINYETFDAKSAAFMWLCVEGLGVKPANILITGGTGSGKTTTLNVLASFIPERERIVTIEDTAELHLPLAHLISLESRPPGLEGTGEITIDILTKNSLRMRPDRVIVGEVRHDEAFTLFTAMNTGHDGAVTGNTLIQLNNGNITEIGEFADKLFEEKESIKENGFEFIELGKEIKVPSFNKQTLKIEDKKITHVWRKKTKEKIMKIKLKNGKELMLTKDHPIYRVNNGIQEINSEEAKAGNFIAIPAQIQNIAEKELIKPYLIGLIYGDGHLGQEAIQFVNNEKSLIDSFKNEINSLTENKISQFDYQGFSRVQVCDKKLIKKINKEYEMPIGNKTKTFKLNEKILSAKNNEIALLLRGLFDSESHVNLKANCIQFSTANKDVARKMPLILLRFGIQSSIYSQEKDGRGNTGPYYRISIYGKDNLIKFSENIGFEHKKKKENLELLIEKSKDSLDLIPNTERLIKRSRLENKMTQTELNALLGTKTRSTINAYETKARNPSRKTIQEICSLMQGKTAKQLHIMAESDLKFGQIVSVKEEEFDGWVYDLTVEDNHNYIANGVVISNCLGTIHANSPQETLVRVTSPPMNVPEVMLSGLDLIIVEHRIHDKKKGTIRRITEIAEVTGVLENKTSTQTLFERDALRDKLIKSNAESGYIKTLMKFTGYNAKQIEKELNDREKFLKKLIDKKIRDMQEVAEAMRDFLNRRTWLNGTKNW